MKNLTRITAALLLAPFALPATEPPAPANSPAPANQPVQADSPSPADSRVPPGSPVADCTALGIFVVGPRTQGGPIPLMSGDSVHGFRPACTLPWSSISPKNAPLAVAACFRGGLLQIDSDAVCGAGKGRLWVSSRWVVTTAKSAPQDKSAGCQQLQTGAYAATRALPAPCVPDGAAK